MASDENGQKIVTKLKCDECKKDFPEGCFSHSQKQKNAKRKCKLCVNITTPRKKSKDKNKKKLDDGTKPSEINAQYTLDIMTSDWKHMFCNVDADWMWQRANVVEYLDSDDASIKKFRINTIPIDATSTDDIYEVITSVPMLQTINEALVGKQHSYFDEFAKYFNKHVEKVNSTDHSTDFKFNAGSPITNSELQNSVRNVLSDPQFRRDFDNKLDHSQRLMQLKQMVPFDGSFPFDIHSFCQYSLDITDYYAENSETDSDILS